MPRRAVLTTTTEAPKPDSVFQQPLPDFTQGEQSDRVMEERFANPRSRQNKETKTKGRKKGAKKKRAFDPSNIIKGRGGIPVKKSTTLMSLVRNEWWGKKPLLELLNKRVRLVDGQFLNKRTTLLSLVKNMPMAKKPLVDVIVNKMP